MKKKIAILLSLLLVVIPFQRQNSIKASNYNAAQNVVVEYCELSATWGNKSSKEIKIPFTIRQNINGIIENEVIITNEYECLTMGPYYDMWEDNVVTNDYFSYAEIKEENSTSFTQLRINEQSMRNVEIRSTTRIHLISYISKVDNDGPIIDDSRVNYEFQLGEVITEYDITDFILCKDQINNAEGHIINCNFERIENFKNVDTSKVGDYPITIVYSDDYGNESEIKKELGIIDNSAPMISLKKLLYFEVQETLEWIDLNEYFNVNSSYEIINFSSNIKEIDSTIFGKYNLIVVLTNSKNETFNYTFKIDIGYYSEDDLFNIGGKFHYIDALFLNSNIEEYKNKIEEELICVYEWHIIGLCNLEFDLTSIDTSFTGTQTYDVNIFYNLEGNSIFYKTIQRNVIVIENEEETVIDEEALKEQVEHNDYTIKGVEDYYLLEMGESISIYNYLDNSTCNNRFDLNEICKIITVNNFDIIDVNAIGTYEIDYVIENDIGQRIIVKRSIRVADIERPIVELDENSEFVKDGIIVLRRDTDFDQLNSLSEFINIENKSGIMDVKFYSEVNIKEIGDTYVRYEITNNDGFTFVYNYRISIVARNHYLHIENIEKEYYVDYGVTLSETYIKEIFENLICYETDGDYYLGACEITYPNLSDVDTSNLDRMYFARLEIKISDILSEVHDIFIIVKDTTAPVINGLENDIVLEVNTDKLSFENLLIQIISEAQSASGIDSTQFDIYDTNGNIVEYGNIYNQVGNYTIKYTIVNNSGYTFEYSTNLIFRDTIRPTINSFENITKEMNEVLLDSEIRAHIESQDYSDNYNEKDELFYTYELIEGDYLYSVKIYDSSLNFVEHLFNVDFIDTTDPLVYLKETDIQLALTTTNYDFMQLLEVYDNSNEELIKELEYTDLQEGIEGFFTASLKVIDSSGNYTTALVNIEVLNINGFLIGDENYKLEYGDTYNELGLGTDIDSVVYTINELQDDSDLGEYTVYYYIIQNDKPVLLNTRTITLVDTTPPTFIHLQSFYYMENDYDFNLLNEFSVIDNHSKLEDRNLLVWVEGDYDSTTSGQYTVEVFAEDSFSNRISKEVKIIVVNA